jgi:hypothetical protein
MTADLRGRPRGGPDQVMRPSLRESKLSVITGDIAGASLQAIGKIRVTNRGRVDVYLSFADKMPRAIFTVV